MKDLVIGAITGYNFNAIEPWVNSLERSGFDGDKAMLCYNISFDVANELRQRGFKVFGFEQNEEQRRLEYTKPNFNVVVERFLHMAFVLRELETKYRYIISTDVKDVIFQRNPSEWLDKGLGAQQMDLSYKVVAASESIRYEQEDWGNFNLFRSFGVQVYHTFRDKIVSNAGVMAGEYEHMLDLFMQIKLLCDGAPAHFIEGGGGPDQAAYNVLINSKPWNRITRFANSEDGWAAQLGTTGPQIQDRYGKFITEPLPILKDGIVCTSTGEPFYIVHQYDRVPQWKNEILAKYK
jgi:hypothetical protein